MTNETNIVEEIITMHEDGKNIGQIEGYLKYAHSFSNKDAKQAIKNAGLSKENVKADWGATVKYLRLNYGKVDKKELIHGMCDVNGKTYLSNQHAYNYITMAIEWAKQEVALSETDDVEDES